MANHNMFWQLLVMGTPSDQTANIISLGDTSNDESIGTTKVILNLMCLQSWECLFSVAHCCQCAIPFCFWIAIN